SSPGEHEYRRARAAGYWELGESFLLRGRASQGAPGVHLVTPLRLEDLAAALRVDRGCLRSADATTADPRPYRVPGLVQVEGLIRIPPNADDAGRRRVDVEFEGVVVPTYQRLDPEVVGDGQDTPVLPFFLERSIAADAAEPLPRGA